jgi:SAM-dependent methyltransferase
MDWERFHAIGRRLTVGSRVPPMTGTWHYGLIARWWAEVNRPEPAELDYLRAAIARFGQPALDLGCGTGRLLVQLLAAKASMSAAGSRAGQNMTDRLTRAAFDELDQPRRYRTIFSIGSFAIGGSAARDAEAVRRIRRHLEPGGAAILSYEVITEADHALLSDPSRYPRPWPQEGSRAALSDGDELELLTRAVGYDAATRTHELEIRARLRRGGEVIVEESGSLRNTYYRPDDVTAMLRDAGFAEVVVEGPYTGRPPDPADETIVIVAR